MSARKEYVPVKHDHGMQALVHELTRKGMSQREIAARLNIGRTSVQRILNDRLDQRGK